MKCFTAAALVSRFDTVSAESVRVEKLSFEFISEIIKGNQKGKTGAVLSFAGFLFNNLIKGGQRFLN